MALPSTITVNYGTAPGTDIVFTKGGTNTSGSITTYYAPSPQNDLAGRPVLEIEQAQSKGGIMRSRTSFKFPIYDANSGAYRGFIGDTNTFTRPATAPLDLSGRVLEIGGEIVNHVDVKPSLVAGTM